MTIDQIKQFQAKLGINIELAQKMGLPILAQTLSEAMSLSAEHERLVRQVQAFAQGLSPDVLEKSKVW